MLLPMWFMMQYMKWPDQFLDKMFWKKLKGNHEQIIHCLLLKQICIIIL